MSEFQSKPYRNFLESHTRLNNFIKISTVSVEFLSNSKKNKKELSNLINELILDSGERWTPRIIQEPKIELDIVKNNLNKSAIIWVYSAFDVFFKEIEGILSSSFENSPNSTENEENEEEKEHKVIELYKKLKWDFKEINEIIIIIKFYEALRHSVAHNIGIPSNKLIQISSDINFTSAIKNWKTKFPKKEISSPPIIIEKEIKLKPHHSILYSEACRRIANDINLRLHEKLETKYFVHKTVQKHINKTNVLTKPECKNVTRYLVYHLKKDYGISINIYKNIYKYFDNENEIKSLKNRYQTLKTTANNVYS